MQLFKDQNKIKEYLDDLLSQRESEDLEFKQATGGFPGSFWDTYSAFANTEGGTIIFGVVEKDDGFYLDILSDELVEKYKREFWSNVNNKSTISCNLLKNDDLQVVKFNGYNIMFFIYLVPAESNVPCLGLPIHIMAHSSGTTKATISARKKKCNVCLPMQTTQHQRTAGS